MECDPSYGTDHLEQVLNDNPDYFENRSGLGSIYEAGVPGCTLKIFSPIEGNRDNAMWRFHNYENGKRLPPGEEGNCFIEEEIFLPETRLLRMKYEMNIPRWMREFAVDIE